MNKIMSAQKLIIKIIAIIILIISFNLNIKADWLPPLQLTDNSLDDTMPQITGDGKKIFFYVNIGVENRYYVLKYIDGFWQPPVRIPYGGRISADRCNF